MKEQPSEEHALIDFGMWETWLASDVGGFASDIDATYRLLLLIRYFARSGQEDRKQLAGGLEHIKVVAQKFDYWMKQYNHPEDRSNRDSLLEWLNSDRGALCVGGDYAVFRALSEVLGTMGYDTLPPPSEREFRVKLAESYESMWLHWSREYGPSPWPPAFGWIPPTVGSSAQVPYRPQAKLEIDHLLDRDDQFIVPGEELTVHRIELASPGGVSFRGLGEPIAQLRELIKDLWYRNRQEKERGELEIIREKIALFSQHGLSPEQVVLVAMRMSDNQQTISDLIDSGKLALEGEERKTEGSPERRRRPRKRRPQ